MIDTWHVLVPLQRDFNPNNQDMAVLGATRAYADWRKANGLEVDFEVYGVQAQPDANEALETPAITKPVDVEGPVREFSDDELKQLESEDPLSLIDSVNLRVGQPLTSGVTSSASLPDCLFRGPTLTLLPPPSFARSQSFASRTTSPTSGALPTTATSRPSSSSSRAPASSTRPSRRPSPARTTRTSSARARPTASSSTRSAGPRASATRPVKRSTRTGAATGSGRSSTGRASSRTRASASTVPSALSLSLTSLLTCLSARRYTYSLCFFGEASQKSNNNNARTSLGCVLLPRLARRAGSS